ncbi:hypothetical protein A7U60_g7742 [Sanghuangporus baumii]|uniref:DUF6534 domain-containing protein n=1 Tax=Sanghuangporus baumii TaxID=108892 RepID=A0A9Q5HSP4_SANBA|nr:hypothetical protein A7U60_g7742 [Sanghuangporus baumii]
MSETSTQVAIDNTYGALLIGTMVAMGLWGAATIQMYYYFNQFPKDEWRLKALVVAVWTLDTTHQGLISHSCYAYLVTNYANPTFLYTITSSLSVMVLISVSYFRLRSREIDLLRDLQGIICFLVQFFLLYRVWRLSEKNMFLVIILFAMSVAQFVTNALYYTKGSNLTVITLSSIAWLSKLVNSLSAGTDVSIAAVLIYLLHRSRTGFKRSETLINKLIFFTINTSALTSIVAVFSVIFVTVYPDALIYVAFYVNISKSAFSFFVLGYSILLTVFEIREVYTNTFFATLNARKSTRDGFDSTYNQGSSMILSRERSEAPPRSANRSQNSRLAIRVETETMQDNDNIVLSDLEHSGVLADPVSICFRGSRYTTTASTHSLTTPKFTIERKLHHMGLLTGFLVIFISPLCSYFGFSYIACSHWNAFSATST